MKTGDIGNTISFSLKDRDGSALPLTGLLTAKLRWKVGDVVVAERSMTIATDTVTYTRVAGDMATAGIYDLEVKLNYSSGAVFYSVNSMREMVEPVLA